MSAPHALEPGTMLVDRYRLDEERGRTGDTTYWRATDELLDRAVGLCLLPADSAAAADVLSAARRAAAVTDPRFLRVLDAAEIDGIVYVVSEWVTATSLADLVSDRVLPAAAARDLAVEVAGALDAAHGQGLAHLCLTPEHVLRTAHGTVKVAGLAVDAAAQGLSPDGDDAERDTRGVAAILYAALTARWPGEAPSRLVHAPYDAGRLCSPRQVKAGVPDDLDAIVAHTLDAGPRHHHHHDGQPPARTPGDLSRRLIGTATTGRMAAIRPAAELPGDTPPPYATGPYVATYDDEGPPRGRVAGRLAYLLVALVLAAGLVVGGYQLATGGGLDGSSASDDPTASPSATSPGQATRVLAVAAAQGFDPEGDGDENSVRAELAVDGDRSTFWNTKTYRQQLGPGGLKDGVGLLLDLGSQQPVRQVTVRTNLDPTTIQVRTAPVTPGAQLDDFNRVARVATANGSGTARLSGARVRYVLLWITELPQEGPQAFRTEISQVSVRG